MTIPVTYLRYVVGEAGAGTNDFQAPGLTLSGAPYGGTLSTHRVLVNSVERTDYTLETGNIVRFPLALAKGDVVEIFRNTDVASSMVTFPTPTGMNPVYFNKAITQLLLGIQELHGKDASILANLTSYVNTAVASIVEVSGAGVIWSTTVSNGDTSLVTPYSFTKGLLMVGGSLYNLGNPSHVTLDNSGANTVINFVTPILGDHEAILIIF